ncbi:hypothetical protein PPSIR1_20979 [Plesiocystis pacifica SIR-1]|uniref:Peptidase C14 caspase domain-containing protein n=1 Tax=Plesiocystis pacifica SIR-1 TaxID=391625 RepID=A6G3D5_9BACT|nr:caspase family protein [Plesiocystis pacifica]EDM79542.1 hypothetical protein PPSIR1_20979 [Plesiocystis pacifica SIR-1]
MTKKPATAGDGDFHIYCIPDSSADQGILQENHHYLAVDAVTGFLNESDSWLRSWIASGMIDISVGGERYQAGLGTFELRGDGRTAPIFDRPVLPDRNYCGGTLTLNVSLFAIKHDTAIATMLKGASRASLGIAAGMVQTATPTGPQRVLGAAAGDLVASLSELTQSSAKTKNLFSLDGLELNLRPDQLRADSTHVLFHRGSSLDEGKLKIAAKGGFTLPLFDGEVLEDGVWVLLRIRRQTFYPGRRPWFGLERGLEADIDNLIADVQHQQKTRAQALDSLRAGSGNTLFDRFRALRLVIQQDGCFTKKEARARVGRLGNKLADARASVHVPSGVRGVTGPPGDGGPPSDDADLRAEVEAIDNRTSDRAGRNHVLLIGVDAYATRPLRGCVNDTLEVAEVLRKHYAVDEEEITLLASAHPGHHDLPDATPATARNIRDALAHLASASVTSEDRVVIHFSGHGGMQVVEGERNRYAKEYILPVDYRERDGQIYDVELNRRLAAIARRTRNLTIILDCCHSGGAARGATVRSCPLPPITAKDLPEHVRHPQRGIGLDVGSAPLIVAACRADQEAEETRLSDGRSMGKLTRALTNALRKLAPEDHRECSWRELWPEIDGNLEGKQQPWLIGDSERRIFGLGLAREPGGLRVQPQAGRYEVFAGTLLNITRGTQIGVYGSEPHSLPRVDSRADDAARVGTLCVEEANPTQAIATAVADFSWPQRPRCRVVRYGEPVLRLSLHGSPERVAELRSELAKHLTDMVSEDVNAPVRVVEDAETGQWVLCDELFGLASDGDYELSRFETDVAVHVLAHYQRYRAPLQLADGVASLPNSISEGLELQLLRAEIQVDDVQDPDLPQIDIDGEGRYRTDMGTHFCVKVFNRSCYPLHVSVLNVARDGQVEWLGSEAVPRFGTHVFWHPDELGRPFVLNGTPGFDRFVAVGATRMELTVVEQLELRQGFADMIERARAGELAKNVYSGGGGRQPTRWASAKVVLQGG